MAEEDDNIPSCSSKAICAVIDWPDQLKSEDELLHITQYPGVYWEKNKQKWQAQKMHNYKKHNLGHYDTAAEAYIAVLEWEKDNPALNRSQWTQGSRPHGKSKYKGVSSSGNHTSPWKAEIKYHGRRYQLGHHKTEEEAARAYDKKCLELRGPDARLNFPLDKP